MTRCIAFLLALVFASLSVSSACLAADLRPVRFSLESGGATNWSTAVVPSRLIGLQIG